MPLPDIPRIQPHEVHYIPDTSEVTQDLPSSPTNKRCRYLAGTLAVEALVVFGLVTDKINDSEPQNALAFGGAGILTMIATAVATLTSPSGRK